MSKEEIPWGEQAQEIVDVFELCGSWEERYRYLVDLGRAMKKLPECARVEANRVEGCASKVWLVAQREEGCLRLAGESDALIVNGLVAVLMALYEGCTPTQILQRNPRAFFERLDLVAHLSPQRTNGFAALTARIQALAARAAVET